MAGSALKDTMEEDSDLFLLLLVSSLNHRLLHWAPRASKPLINFQEAPEFVQQGVNELLATIMRDEHGPSLRARGAPERGPSNIAVTSAGHVFEDRRSCRHANPSHHVSTGIDVGRRNATFNVDHDVMKESWHRG